MSSAIKALVRAQRLTARLNLKKRSDLGSNRTMVVISRSGSEGPARAAEGGERDPRGVTGLPPGTNVPAKQQQTSDLALRQRRRKVRFASHPIVEYQNRFRLYNTADVLIISQSETMRQRLLRRVTNMIIKDRPSSQSHWFADDKDEGDDLAKVDHGRNATANCCRDVNNASSRLFDQRESYAVVLVHEPGFISGTEDVGIIRALRDRGYKRVVAAVVEECSMATSKRCRDHGADACLVENTGTFSLELSRMLTSLAIRHHRGPGAVATPTGRRRRAYSATDATPPTENATASRPLQKAPAPGSASNSV